MRQGTGKTTAGVAIAYEEHLLTGRSVISNNHLKFPGYKHFDVAWFVEQMSGGNELEDAELLWDEIYQAMDSRASASKLNRLSTYFIVQTRKRGIDLYICTHSIENVDVRLRRAVDIRGASRFYTERPCKNCRCKSCGGSGRIPSKDGYRKEEDCPDCSGVGGTGTVSGKTCERCLGFGQLGFVQVSFLDRRLRRRYTSDIFPYFNGPIFANKYWPLFDTKERMPIQAKLLRGIDVSEVVS